jgi:hypothetical protein
VRSYLYSEDLKHYSVEHVPGISANNEYVMAGTIFNSSGHTDVHFLHFVGNNKVDDRRFSVSTASGDVADLRVVDIVCNKSGDSYITCLLRDWTGIWGGNDMVKIIKVDNSGNLQPGDVTFQSSVDEYGNMYPINSMLLY